MDYITKLSKETDASLHTYILLFSEKQLKKLEEIYYKIDNPGFLFNEGEFLVDKHTGELAIVHSTSIIMDNERLYKLQLCGTSDIASLEKNYVESHYSLAEA
jgi:hypothetical protein